MPTVEATTTGGGHYEIKNLQRESFSKSQNCQKVFSHSLSVYCQDRVVDPVEGFSEE